MSFPSFSKNFQKIVTVLIDDFTKLSMYAAGSRLIFEGVGLESMSMN